MGCEAQLAAHIYDAMANVSEESTLVNNRQTAFYRLYY